ncbi:MAG: hypothetical protein ACXWV5_11745 [Flavitalea sp.]
MKDLLNILSNSNKDIDNQKLMDYLSGKLSSQEANEVEQWLNENEFGEDALEGLQKVRSKEDINLHVELLNKQLGTFIRQKKQRRDRRKIDNLGWSIVAILVVILLVVLAYIVLKM